MEQDKSDLPEEVEVKVGWYDHTPRLHTIVGAAITLDQL